MRRRMTMKWVVGLVLIGMMILIQVPAAAQSVDEFVEALSPDSTKSNGRTRGLGGIQAKTSTPQKAMYLQFGLNSAMLTASAKETLDQLGQALERKELRAFTYRLEGHTCDLGSDALNMELSKRRALSVKRYLNHHFGIPQRQLEVVWFGESQPAVPNDDENTRRKNRRVVIANTLKPMGLMGKKDGTLQIRRLREGVEKVINDGESMNQKDNYALEFKTTGDSYVYLFQKDSTGKLTHIFPNEKVSDLKNPLRPNSFYRMPGPDKWFFLDENKGTEEILMIATGTPLKNPLNTMVGLMESNWQDSKYRGLGGIHRKKAQSDKATPTIVKTLRPKSKNDLHLFKRYFIHE